MAPTSNVLLRSAKAKQIMQAWKPLVISEKRSTIPSLAQLSRRGKDGDDSPDSMINLMLIILGLIFFALILASLLFLFRRRRMQRLRKQALPTYEEDAKLSTKQRGLTIETTHNGRSSVFYIGRDGQPMLQNPQSPPHSPDNVPQIHITFPDEKDENGRSQSGRVLVVRVGDNAAVGLEPMHNEPLPAYEKESKSQFQSIDMDQIGGLKEKDRTIFH